MPNMSCSVDPSATVKGTMPNTHVEDYSMRDVVNEFLSSSLMLECRSIQLCTPRLDPSAPSSFLTRGPTSRKSSMCEISETCRPCICNSFCSRTHLFSEPKPMIFDDMGISMRRKGFGLRSQGLLRQHRVLAVPHTTWPRPGHGGKVL